MRRLDNVRFQNNATCRLIDSMLCVWVVRLILACAVLPGIVEVHAQGSRKSIEQLVRRSAVEAKLFSIPGGLDALTKHLTALVDGARSTKELSIVRNGFLHPLGLAELEGSLAQRVSKARLGDSHELSVLIEAILDLSTKPVSFRAQDASASDREVLGAEALARDLLWNIAPPDETITRHLALISEAPALSRAILSAALLFLDQVTRRKELLLVHSKDRPLDRSTLPADLTTSVAGEILFHRSRGDGRFEVVGGAGTNTYNMARLDAVFDVAGDDQYEFKPVVVEPACRNHLIFDLAGNDTYESRDDFCGPGVAQFGLSLVDDAGGDDRYSASGEFSIAAGLFGVGIVIDRGGDDRYANNGPHAGWSEGAGLYGAGVLLDLAGNDEYSAQRYSQGCGGPSGFGAVIDIAGDDLYRANGREYPSVYQDHWVYSGMSQGFGFGIRKYAPGGLGAVYDYAGDDRYEGGEFTQATAYYWGFGVLHDFRGNDFYYASRFGQSSGAHQALSVLVDDSGDDTYWGKTSSSQAGPWDESIGFLLDNAGDDTYRCDELCQGAGAQQSIGILVDSEGADHYVAGKTHQVGRAQGAAGKNEYHFAASGNFSFGAILDLAGDDFYSTGLRNHGVRIHSTPDRSDLSRSEIFGLALDR